MVETLKMAYVILFLFDIVFSDIPISYPGRPNSWATGGKLVPYNMIDANPSCYERGTCPIFKPGGRLSAFPNSVEKIEATFHNLARMFANCTLNLKWMKWRFGANDKGGLTYWCPGCKFCGDGTPGKHPMYWYAPANHVARFKQYDENSCDQDWYKQNGQNAHSTCNWVLPEFGGGSHCDLFGGCDWSKRAAAYCEEDRCWFETEGICGMNSCYVDPHCEPIFNSRYDYQGTGFVEGMNGVDTQYVRFTKEIFYLLPTAAHFDERMRVVPDDYHPESKHFTLMLEYWDDNRTQKPDTCWSLYNGAAHVMEVAISDNANGNVRTSCANGFTKNAFSVMFVSFHDPPENTCEPYAFLCKTTLGNFFRLPEEGHYYFGTEWMDWKWSDYKNDFNLQCKENHYYYNGNQWIVNGAPELKKCDIWYYNDANFGTCIGCSKIAQLDCISNCIYSDSVNNCNCNNVIGQDLGDEMCTPSPTRDPLPGVQTYAPTPSPTPAPSDPTTARPSRSPIPQPTRNPLANGQTYAPTHKPSRNPLPEGFTHAPTIRRAGMETTDDDALSVGSDDDGGNAGGIAAGVILGLLCIICILAWVYFRIQTGKPLYPTRSEIRLPQLPKKTSSRGGLSRGESEKESQMKRQLSNQDKVRRVQSIQAMEESDDEMEEGNAHYSPTGGKIGKMGAIMKKIGGKGSKGNVNVKAKAKAKAKAPAVPRNRPPPPPTDAVKNGGGGGAVAGLHLGGMNDNNEDVNEATPLSRSDDNRMQYPEQNSVLSIVEAKNMSGVEDKEKYLSDEDFISVFGMSKNDFYKLPKWKQKNAKKKHGFF